jgi:hypothetical protein
LYNSASGGTNPACKGVSFDGEMCVLFSVASEADLINSSGTDSAILYQKIVSNNSTINGTISNTLTITALPTVVAASTTSFSGCSGTTVTESDSDVSYTWTCSSYSSWFTEIIQAITTIYQATTIVERGAFVETGATSGATGTGGLSGPVSTASATSTTFVSSGSGGGSNSTGGFSSPIVTYITTTISNSSTVIASTLYVSAVSSAASGVGSATPVSYYNITITTGTTIINNSTIFETSVLSTAYGVRKIIVQM